MDNTPGYRDLETLIKEIKNGSMKLPQFQRKYVWKITKSARLIDSILKKYPIGSVIVWNSRDELRSVRSLGDLEFEQIMGYQKFEYVLDGQQRLTSIIAAYMGVTIGKEDFSKIFINLTEDVGSDKLVVIEENGEILESPDFISLKKLLSNDLTDLKNNHSVHFELLETYKKRILDYKISIIYLDDCPLDIATEIFSRLNIEGTRLSDFEIMVAKTYSNEPTFDLSERFKSLTKELKDYSKFNEQSLLQVLALLRQSNIDNDCSKKTILSMSRVEVLETWEEVVCNIKRSCNFLISHLGIKTIDILPYSAILVVFTYFFKKLGRDRPTPAQEKFLTDFFWRASLGYRYTTGPDTKIKSDCLRMDMILNELRPAYDWSIKTNITPEYIKDYGEFKKGSSYIKGLICLLMSIRPRSFKSNFEVELGKANLLISMEKNYHHFFPKGYLSDLKKETGKTWRYIDNHILNITILDKELNQNEIKKRAPSDYMEEYSRNNIETDSTMATHMIGDLEKFGIWSDDYDLFINERAKQFSKLLQEKIILNEEENDIPNKNEFLEMCNYYGDENLFLCSLKEEDLYAIGHFHINNGEQLFKIFKGSRMKLEHLHKEGRTRTWLNARLKIIEEGTVIMRDGFYEFEQDYILKFPSVASSIILGREASHSYYWKNNKGVNIK